MSGPAPTLRSSAPWRVLEGFGNSQHAVSRVVRPRSIEELAGTFRRARAEGFTIAFRGAGRSYGDAALNQGQLVVDTCGLDRVHGFDTAAGVIDADAGVTIEGLWRAGLPNGWWPRVVPGTMFPTLGGAVAMNIHGKNCFKEGPFGEHVGELDLLTADGQLRTLSRERDPELFRATIGGLGLLGAVTRATFRFTRVASGRLRVRPIRTANLAAMFDCFTERLPHSDYLVGWIDCFAGGPALGRGLVHQANYLSAGDDPGGAQLLDPARQGLPPSILGVPRSVVWRFMRMFTHDPGVQLVNAAKFHLPEAAGRDGTFLESHVAFAFLLDYVPEWRRMYGPDGFIQFQVFLPDTTARAALADLLERCRRRGVVSYLGVFKRHRPDEFLLTHGLDGWSLAMDFPVHARDPKPLRSLTRELTELVIEAGGTFYAAKDSVLDAGQFERAYGERLERFRAIKRRLDPEGLFVTDQARRLGLVR